MAQMNAKTYGNASVVLSDDLAVFNSDKYAIFPGFVDFSDLRRFGVFARFAGLTRFVEERRGFRRQKDRARQRQAEQNERSDAERQEKETF